jgi:hypothetical protein
MVLDADVISLFGEAVIITVDKYSDSAKDST